MLIGFTGTRRGLRKPQLRSLAAVFKGYKEFSFMHGGATGADSIADSFVWLYKVKDVEVYPCDQDRWLFWITTDDGKIREIHEPLPPLMRNKIIANKCDELVATPNTDNEILRSGTWATIRYARKAGKPITLVYPDGTVVRE